MAMRSDGSVPAGALPGLVLRVVTLRPSRDPDAGVDHGHDDVGEGETDAGRHTGEEGHTDGTVDVVVVDGGDEVEACALDREDLLDEQGAGHGQRDADGDAEGGR